MQATTISIADLETRAARGWQAPQEEWLGGWLLRAADGFTGRANSAPLRRGAAVVMTAAPKVAASCAGPAAPVAAAVAVAVAVAAAPDEDWLAMYHYRGDALPPVGRRLLMSAPWQAFASVREEGQTVAIGRVAGDAGWAGLTAIETHPGHQRRGLATAVSATLAALAADRGATGLYVQVEEENTGARALYGGIGFCDHHRYHYRVGPDASS
ncbi:MAG TPA: GNAT family N-acetyltransferase [Streptosporangiaceae bacterium]